MFGDKNMQDMMGKLQEMQGAVEKSKSRLESIYVKGETEDGRIRFVMDGNRLLKEITIDESLVQGDQKEELENALMTAFNKALEDANHVNESEMKNTAFGMFPGMGG